MMKKKVNHGGWLLFLKNRNKDEKDTKEELLYEEFAPKLRMGPQFERPTISRETGAKPYIDH